MSGYVPPGYLSLHEAAARVAQARFGDEMRALEKAHDDELAAAAARAEAISDPLARVIAGGLGLPQVPARAVELLSQALTSLRDALFTGKLKAVCFGVLGQHQVPAEFWATTAADDAVSRGLYNPYSTPNKYRHPGAARVFVREAELAEISCPLAKSTQHEGAPSRHLVALRKPGPPPVKALAIEAEMRAMDPNRLRSMKQEEMAAVFSAAGTYCRTIRERVLAEIERL